MPSESSDNRIIVVTAPSGSGKTTIVKHLLGTIDNLEFSISATTRPKRPYEEHGVDYYFLSKADFMNKVGQNEFVEWEEVYENKCYGTLRSELTRLWSLGKQIIFDVDVKGALSLKEQFPDSCLSIFIKVPSLEHLKERLKKRNTETEEALSERLRKYRQEAAFETCFDVTVVNDNLSETKRKAEKLVRDFLQGK